MNNSSTAPLAPSAAATAPGVPIAPAPATGGPTSLEEEIIAMVNSMGIEFTTNPTFEEVVARLKNYLVSHPRSAAAYMQTAKMYIKDCIEKNRPVRNSDSLSAWIHERHEVWVQYQKDVKASLDSNGTIPMPERPAFAFCCNTLWSYGSMINTILKIAFRVDLCEENPGNFFYLYYKFTK